MNNKKVRKYESNMTYLANFVVIDVKGLFHSDWSGAWPSAGEEEMGKSSNSPLHYRGELWMDLAGLLDSAQV
jgi:hypothetical protein